MSIKEYEKILCQTAGNGAFSGIALERWFLQKMMESCRYRQIGGWWQPGGTNAKGNRDDFEIDIVAETLDGEVEAI